MSDLIRSGNAGRCALVLVVLFGSLVLCQEAPKQDAPAQTAKDDATAKAATVPQETPATPPATTPPTAAAPTVTPPPVVAPPDAAPPAKGKASSKKAKGKGAPPAGLGQVTAQNVQEKPYEIGPEDVLYLNVLHQPDVSSNLEVRPDGFVSVRFAGEVKAAGLTAQQLSDVIAEKLTVYFNHPEVNIQILRINSKKYYIQGEIHRPGAYALTAPKTIYEALIEAGGPAEFAKKTKIYIQRGSERFPFNYRDVTAGKNLKQNVLLQNGDVIVVP